MDLHLTKVLCYESRVEAEFYDTYGTMSKLRQLLQQQEDYKNTYNWPVTYIYNIQGYSTQVKQQTQSQIEALPTKGCETGHLFHVAY